VEGFLEKINLIENLKFNEKIIQDGLWGNLEFNINK
jgi:hypothetical protein